MMINRALTGSLLIALSFIANQAFATVFAGDEEPTLVQVMQPSFLKSVGIEVTTSTIGDDSDSELKVSFTTSEHMAVEDIHFELLLLDSNNHIVLVVETPFTNTVHTVSYLVPKGFSLAASIAKPISKNTEYYKVVFDNYLK